MIGVSPEPETSSFGMLVDGVATDLDRDQTMSRKWHEEHEKRSVASALAAALG
jgi:hypothetical protein